MILHLRTKPLGRATSATTTSTDGEAFAVPNGDNTITVKQVKIYVSGAAYVGYGAVETPIAAASATNSVYQESGTEEVYTFNGVRQLDPAFIYVYAVTGTITVRLSFFG